VHLLRARFINLDRTFEDERILRITAPIALEVSRFFAGTVDHGRTIGLGIKSRAGWELQEKRPGLVGQSV
jgi:hypothetical protein